MPAKRGNALSKGSTLQGGRYVIQRTLGQGGFGITYCATDTHLRRLVATKELYPGGSERKGTTVTIPSGYTHERWSKAVASFSREAQILSVLHHPGIVTVYDHFEENNTAYMVMRYIKGVNLAQVAEQRGGRLPEAEVLGYAAEVGDALSILHKSMMLHRDVKPSNIMLDGQGHAVLIDFGAARAFIPDKTATYSVVLTQGFAPPEQVVGRGRLGPTADIYALAATCYYLLTGDLPTFREEDDSRLHEGGNSISPRLLRVLEHGLALNSANRPQNVSSFLAELQGHIAPPTPVSKPAAQAHPLPVPTEDAQNYETEVPDVQPAIPDASAMRDNLAALDGDIEQEASVKSSLYSAPTLPNKHDPLMHQDTSSSSKAPFIPFVPPAHKYSRPGMPWFVMASTLAALVLLAGAVTLLSGRSNRGSITETPLPVTTSKSPAALPVVVIQTASEDVAFNNTSSNATAVALSTQEKSNQAAGATHTAQTQFAVQFSATAQAQATATAQTGATATSEQLSHVAVTAQAQSSATAWAAALQQSVRTLQGHTGYVVSVAFSPDGQTLASGSTDHTIKLWRVSDGTLLRTLTGHTDWAVSVAFSPDGQTLASGSADYTIKLWRVSDGTTLRTLTGRTYPVWSVAFSPDGQTLASGSNDETVRLWRVSDGTTLRTLTGHTGYVVSVAFSPDGQTLASGSADSTIKLWRVSDGTTLRTLTGHTDWPNSVAFSPDGQTLASGSADHTIKLWRVSDGTLLRTLTGPDSVLSVAFSPDGQTLASGSADHTIKLWRVH